MRVCQTSFTVSDLDRSVAFYRDVLGLTLKHMAAPKGEKVSAVTGYPGSTLRTALLYSGEHEVELIQYLTPAGKPQIPERRDAGAAHMAFRSKDIEADYRRLKDKGVRFVSPPQDFGTAKACYFTDPDGITLELLQRNG